MRTIFIMILLSGDRGLVHIERNVSVRDIDYCPICGTLSVFDFFIGEVFEIQ
mgnify:CR=1 FL=1